MEDTFDLLEVNREGELRHLYSVFALKALQAQPCAVPHHRPLVLTRSPAFLSPPIPLFSRVLHPRSQLCARPVRCWTALLTSWRRPDRSSSTPKTPPPGRSWPATPAQCQTQSRASSPPLGVCHPHPRHIRDYKRVYAGCSVECRGSKWILSRVINDCGSGLHF